MSLLSFFATNAGRLTRVIAGGVLVVGGALIGGAGWILAVVGLVPLFAGTFDVCVLAPLMGKAFSGKQFRSDARS